MCNLWRGSEIYIENPRNVEHQTPHGGPLLQEDPHQRLQRFVDASQHCEEQLLEPVEQLPRLSGLEPDSRPGQSPDVRPCPHPAQSGAPGRSLPSTSAKLSSKCLIREKHPLTSSIANERGIAVLNSHMSQYAFNTSEGLSPTISKDLIPPVI